ncbi:acetylcholine receptor subunit alpha-L1 [Clonorchis sinensis]|uniref:Acetylcholine receptor subunit alpha-L1 n=1 Tax=Clonorchis sinensis TaxID=79923 RepID=H2KUL6_CLOSI|nr:acetylcholine receptor subunit alpha-L1 [Clonorchis sinensis]
MLQVDDTAVSLTLLTSFLVIHLVSSSPDPVHLNNPGSMQYRQSYWPNLERQSKPGPTSHARLRPTNSSDREEQAQFHVHEHHRIHWAEKRLVKDLLCDYEKNSRPVVDGLTPVVWITPTIHTQQITVEFGLELLQILDLDEMDQVVTVSVRTLHKWKDYNLIWDPADYDGISSVTVPSSYLWLPDIALYNYADERLSERRPCEVRVYSDGTVFWGPMAIFKSMCSVEIRNFPFDRQLCHLKFGPWAHDGFRLNVTFYAGEQNLRMTSYVTNQEWSVTRTRAVFTEISYPCCPEKYPDISFYIEMRRQSAFYTYILILPSVLLSVLTAVVFWLPPETPSKIILAMNVFVAFLLLHLLLEDTTPASASSFPLLGAYYCFNMGVITMSMYLCCITVNLHFRGNDDSEPPEWLKRICRILGPKLMVNVTSLAVSQIRGKENDNAWNKTDDVTTNTLLQHASRSPSYSAKPSPLLGFHQPDLRAQTLSNRHQGRNITNFLASDTYKTTNIPPIYPPVPSRLPPRENHCVLCTQELGVTMDLGPYLPCFCQPIAPCEQTLPGLFSAYQPGFQSMPTLSPTDPWPADLNNRLCLDDDLEDSSFLRTFKDLLVVMDRMHQDVRYITKAVRQLEHRQSIKTLRLEHLDHWRTICLVLDRVFFILYTITIFLSYFLFHPSLVNFD